MLVKTIEGTIVEIYKLNNTEVLRNLLYYYDHNPSSHNLPVLMAEAKKRNLDLSDVFFTLKGAL